MTLIAHPATVRSADPPLQAWGQNVYQKINESLRVPGSNLYAEAASLDGDRYGGDGGFAYVWPVATQFRVLNALVRINPTVYAPILRAFADELHTRYWRNGTGAAGGYRSGVSSGATLFYDDNGHLVVSLAEAYNLTGEPRYLDRAVAAYNFVISGEDLAGGGGIYFSVPDHSSKDAVSTLQAARAALLLYPITGQTRYLDDANRLYAWAASHVQQSNGLFKERFLLTGNNAGTSDGYTLINSAGIGISCNLLFYDATGNVADLHEAQRISHTSVAAYFTDGAIRDEGYWAFELVDALNNLYLHDYNPAWLQTVITAMTWLHTNREDPNGHYGRLWSRDPYTPGTIRTSWELNDQAAVARSYLYTAATMATPVDLTPPGPVAEVATTIAYHHITLSWTNPPDLDLVGTRIVFKTTGYPTGPTDGTLLADQPGVPDARDQYVHANVECNTSHYYAIFAYDATLNYSPTPTTPVARIQCSDFDLDHDVDLDDFAFLQRCLSGNAVSYAPGCAPADLDADGDADPQDLRLFSPCLTGPGQPPGC